MTHLKTYRAPKSWSILRKENVFTARPNPGAHPLERAIPVSTLLKQLGIARITRETQRIINNKAITIDGKTAKDRHTGVGFMDIIHVEPDITLRCGLNKKGKLTFTNIPKDELTKKVCKIISKQTIKGGKIQLGLSSGRTILADNKDYTVGDSLLLEVPAQTIKDHFALKAGNTVFLIGGRHIGTTGTITDIKGDQVWVKTDKETLETHKDFTYVVGKNKSAITL